MRKHLLVAALASLLFCALFSVAQDAPKTEIFGGYSYLHLDTGSTNIDNSVPEGVDVDATHYLIGPFGVTADFEWHRKNYPLFSTTANLYGLLGGPRFKAHVGKIEPFGHLLVGFTHGSLTPNLTSTGGSDNTLTMKLGGGLDWAATRHFAVRLAEANLYYTEFKRTSRLNFNNSGTQNNFSLSTGIVFRP